MPTEFVKIVGPDCQNFARSAIWRHSHCIAASPTSVEMNILGTFPFHIIAFYCHLFGYWADVAVFLRTCLSRVTATLELDWVQCWPWKFNVSQRLHCETNSWEQPKTNSCLQCIIAFYCHLFGYWADVAVFLALYLLKIESAIIKSYSYWYLIDHLQC
jgi:hypothetical protein